MPVFHASRDHGNNKTENGRATGALLKIGRKRKEDAGIESDPGMPPLTRGVAGVGRVWRLHGARAVHIVGVCPGPPFGVP